MVPRCGAERRIGQAELPPNTQHEWHWHPVLQQLQSGGQQGQQPPLFLPHLLEELVPTAALGATQTCPSLGALHLSHSNALLSTPMRTARRWLAASLTRHRDARVSGMYAITGIMNASRSATTVVHMIGLTSCLTFCTTVEYSSRGSTSLRSRSAEDCCPRIGT